MLKVFKYSFLDLMRNRWTLGYFLFFACSTFGLLYLSGDSSKVVISTMNIIILLVPLVSLIYGQMYLYQVRDYVEILLAQPISRQAIFGGYYLALAAALSISLLLGLCIPILIVQPEGFVANGWLSLLAISAILTFVFIGIACNLVLRFDNRLKGFGVGLFIWLFLAIIYDGLILVIMLAFENYPLENASLILTLLNPIDAGRVLLIFQLDYSALMGFTGAVFAKFFGTLIGSVVLTFAFGMWLFVPLMQLMRKAKRKDF